MMLVRAAPPQWFGTGCPNDETFTQGVPKHHTR